MEIARKPDNEAQRLKKLLEFTALNIEYKLDLDSITYLAKQLCDFPISVISLVDQDFVYFKSKIGIDIDLMPREISFCAHAILQDQPLIVEDATVDPRFFDNPMVNSGPKIRSYIGVPLVSLGGFKVGVLCMMHTISKRISDSQLASLVTLGKQAIIQFELKMALAEEKKKELLLFQAEKMSLLGEMAGGIAHEINNPLSIINWKSMTLKQKIDDNKFEKELFKTELDKIVATTDRISKIVRGLRTFSRNADADPFEKVTIKSIVEDSIELCQEKFKKSNIELKINIDRDEQFECRSAQIIQILLNLLSNASDAIESFENKWIQIDVKTEPNLVIFSVCDCGNGIPANVVEQMMRPFFTTKQKGKGTGLGLSISLGIAKQHNGNLIYDTKSRNTRFELILPKSQKKTN